jgi:hypothetical protein
MNVSCANKNPGLSFSFATKNPKDVGPAIANSNQSLGGEKEVFETILWEQGSKREDAGVVRKGPAAVDRGLERASDRLGLVCWEGRGCRLSSGVPRWSMLVGTDLAAHTRVFFDLPFNGRLVLGSGCGHAGTCRVAALPFCVCLSWLVCDACTHHLFSADGAIWARMMPRETQ